MTVSKRIIRRFNLGVCSLFLALAFVVSQSADAQETIDRNHNVRIPEADYFTPFAMTIHAGDTVTWTNTDTDDHTVVSDDAYSTARYKRIDVMVKGTTSNGGKPGKWKMTFTKPGTFIYYCRFHAMLNAQNQPVAPGPDGGVQDPGGNFGTPMMGVIVVMP